MVHTNGHSENGDSQQEYNPVVEFEYLDADVWIETDADGNQDVAYTQDVLEALEDDEQSDSNGDSD
ncbi:hypothetical protein PCC7424_5426 (plasmid) [Gloeothece citriformis PCC 7424]|uniref:Uncharacterized protein n=1 Tax=Gloeothece citriformis (strain PCC 7424) TaxID=65393 RepID=B7KMH9_GLOC7|nr:hypothetical protein [Gloeothece citriformis]ACK74001.1 hypothetical protein PCC7424_5426 [Gloeothece citriformis PCC 7424]